MILLLSISLIGIMIFFFKFIFINVKLPEFEPDIDFFNKLTFYFLSLYSISLFFSPEIPDFKPYLRLPINKSVFVWIFFAEKFLTFNNLILILPFIFSVFFFYYKGLIDNYILIVLVEYSFVFFSIHLIFLCLRMQEIRFFLKLIIVGVYLFVLFVNSFAVEYLTLFIFFKGHGLSKSLLMIIISFLIFKYCIINQLKYINE